MLKINVASVGDGTMSHVLASCVVELTSEDGTEVAVLHGRVLRNRSGELWVGFPSQSLFRSDGVHRFGPAIEFSKNLAQRISDAVLDAYKAQPERRQEVGAHACQSSTR